MRIITPAEIRSVLTPQMVTAVVRQALIDHAGGRGICPPPLQMLFPGPDGVLSGDCHVKAAMAADQPVFVVKVATGFYGNAAQGLPVNGGAVLLFNSRTGTAEALIQDDGLLTAWRTAAAAVAAVSLVPVTAETAVGIIGTGTQAALLARWIPALTPVRRIVIWGRTPERTQSLADQLRADGLDAVVAPDRRSLCRTVRVVVTCTPAQQPVLRMDDWDGSPLHVVALGADSPGKSELDPDLFRRAAIVLTDDRAQCLDHGDFGQAVRAGVISSTAARPLGEALHRGHSVPADSLTIVDLTGLGGQDLAVASLLWQRLGA